jgi:hypothetical protein
MFAGPKIIRDGLVLHLDALNPKSYPGTGTLWKDLSRNNNHMVSMGNAHTTFNANGYFTTSGIAGDYWRNAALHKTFNNEDLTLSVWCYPTSNSSSMLWVWKNGSPGPDLYTTGNLLTLNTWDGAGNPFSGYNLSADGWSGSWKQVVVVWEYSTLKSHLYINGQFRGSATYKSPASNQLNIGGSASNYVWNGSIANVKLHDRVLSSEEISVNYNATKSRYGII